MNAMTEKPIRILHVVGGMNRGGIETWLMHVLRYIDRQQFQMDFVANTDKLCAYDEEVRALGSRIIPCLSPSRPWDYARNFRRILREYGPYDVVHSHVHHFSGFTLRLAKQAGVPVRIAHSHNDTSSNQRSAGRVRKLYLTLSERWIHQYATSGLACSRLAAASLFGPQWEADPRMRLLYYGIDLEPFRASVNRQAVRAELGIPDDAFVIGHVGRFLEQKNHTFLVKIAQSVVERLPQTRFLLVGDGALRPTIEQQVHQAGLEKHIIFAGLRSDIATLMLGAMDVFVLPSLYEGLPLVLLEAQSAGLPCVVSDTVSAEGDMVGPLVQRCSLAQPPAVWADAILAARARMAKDQQPDALARVAHSPFNVRASVRQLESVYRV